MEDVKAKYWNPDKEVFIDPEYTELFFTVDDGLLHVGIYDKNDDYTELNIILFTGLKDKNGVDIYEGDIVKGGSDEPYKQMSHIVFRNGSFKPDSEFFGYEGEGLWDWDEIEVIGNTYQIKIYLNEKDQTKSN